MSRVRQRLIAVAGALALLGAAPARADDVGAAAAAFRRAQAADLGGDHRHAAELYEVANGIARSPEALRAALRARRAAGDAEMAATHAEVLRELYGDDESSASLANSTLAELGPTLLRVELRCKPSKCTAVADDVAVSTEPRLLHVFYLRPGLHEVRASFGGTSLARKVAKGAAGEALALELVAPPQAARPRAAHVGRDAASGAAAEPAQAGQKRSRHGLSPVWFYAGAGATLALAGAATWSGLDTLAARDVYDENRTEQGYEDGLARERRTNLLLGSAALAGVATAALGAWFTDWSGGDRSKGHARVGASPMLDGSSMSLTLVVTGAL